MNKMKEVAKLLGVEVEERFNIVDCKSNPYCLFENIGLIDCTGAGTPFVLMHLLTGKFTIEKLPFKPNYGDYYYYVTYNGVVAHTNWQGIAFDYYCYNANNCFKTKEEITEEDTQRIVREMKEKYIND